jgi:hypothetical protein
MFIGWVGYRSAKDSDKRMFEGEGMDPYDVERMAYSPSNSLPSGPQAQRRVGGAMATAVSELGERVEALIVECANLLQRRADLEWSAAALGTQVGFESVLQVLQADKALDWLQVENIPLSWPSIGYK